MISKGGVFRSLIPSEGIELQKSSRSGLHRGGSGGKTVFYIWRMAGTSAVVLPARDGIGLGRRGIVCPGLHLLLTEDVRVVFGGIGLGALPVLILDRARTRSLLLRNLLPVKIMSGRIPPATSI